MGDFISLNCGLSKSIIYWILSFFSQKICYPSYIQYSIAPKDHISTAVVCGIFLITSGAINSKVPEKLLIMPYCEAKPKSHNFILFSSSNKIF